MHPRAYTRAAAWLSASGGARREHLVAAAEQPLERIDQVRVDPDENPRTIPLDAAEDDRGGLVGSQERDLRELLRELVGRLVGRARGARDPGLDPAGVHTADRDRIAEISSSWRSASVNPRTANFAAQ